MNPRCYEQEMKTTDPNMQEAVNPGCPCPPVYECPETRVCERYIMHEVPHVIPVHTKIVNHHIIRHTYTPCFTISECDTCEHVYDPCCKNF